MASPAWLPQEVQSLTSQASVSGPPAGGSSVGTSAPISASAPVVVTPNLEGSNGASRDSVQESAQSKLVNAPGYFVPASSFSYSGLPNADTSSGGSQQSSSSPVVKSSLQASPVVLHAPVRGLSSSTSPSFSYNISQTGFGFPSNPQFQSGMPVAPGHLQGGKGVPLSMSASLQPPVPGQSAPPNSFVLGTAAQVLHPPLPVPKGTSSNGAGFSFSGNSQLIQKDQPLKSNIPRAVAEEASILSSASAVSRSLPLPANTSTPNLGPATSWMPTTPSFAVPSGFHGTPGTPGPPGLAPSTVTDSSSSVLRPSTPNAPVPSNPIVQQQMYAPYPSLPAMAASPQGLWLQPPQMGSMPRPPFLPYPAVFPGPFPLPAHNMPLPPAPLPDSQPPGVTALGTAGAIPTSSAASGHQLVGSSGMQPELPFSGNENSKHTNDFSTKDGAAVSEESDAWTAYKTETGVVYYYNALTNQSTYQKPSAFKGEPDRLAVQPTPISWEMLAGTDWQLVTTTDGKKYYHNVKTQLTSWKIPSEVAELRKKQDSDVLKEHLMVVPNTIVSAEKGSVPVSLSVPAVNTGGRDAIALRTSSVPGSSSALDLIKKKLQDPGAPVTSSPVPASSGTAALELNGSRAVEATVKGVQSENSKDKLKDSNGDGNVSDSSSDSEDAESGPTKEECIIQFKEMLKERGVAPFSKWEKELPKIVFDPRFKAIPSHSARRSIFEHYVKTRAEEERKEKRAAQKAAIEGFKQLLEEAAEDIDCNTDYQTLRKKWGNDLRFEGLNRKDRELLLHERVVLLKKAAEEKAQAKRAAATSSFKSMLQDKGDITINSRWSRVKDCLRNDPRYKSVKHEDREIFFNEYISELKAAEEVAEQEAKAKRGEQDKLKERERELRKRKEREEQEMERVRVKVRRKEAVVSFQALLVETIKDPQASWTESKPKLEKDPQGRASNRDLEPSDIEKLFREHVKMLQERCAHEFKALLAEVLTVEAAAQETEDGKTVLNSWSTAKRLLKSDPRYSKMPRKEREVLWRRCADEMLRKQKAALDLKEEKQHTDTKSKSSADFGRFTSGVKRSHERR